jgi:hypothetical protein
MRKPYGKGEATTCGGDVPNGDDGNGAYTFHVTGWDFIPYTFSVYTWDLGTQENWVSSLGLGQFPTISLDTRAGGASGAPNKDSGGQTKSTPMKGERGVLHVLAIEGQFTLSRISGRISRAPSLPQYQTAMYFLLQFPDKFRRS